MNTKNQQILKLQAIKLLNNATMSPTKKYFERQQTGLHNDYTNLISRPLKRLLSTVIQ